MAERFLLGAEQGRERVDRVVCRLLGDVSRTTVQRWITEGRVAVGGVACRARDWVRAGDVVLVERGAGLPTEAEPDPTVEVTVLFEDDHLIVVNKPSGLVVHPARGHRTGTLVNGLLARPGFPRLAGDGPDPAALARPGIVQRLDRDTSGVLVVAKDEATREGLKAALKARAVEREYVALTVGLPKSGTITSLHGRHPRSRLRFSTQVRDGKRAVTHVRVLEPLLQGLAALVGCRLETGRTHQIRVQLAEISKTPILGDALYGPPPRHPHLRAIAGELGRQALHAQTLGFAHPITGERLRFEAPLPADMSRALGALRHPSVE